MASLTHPSLTHPSLTDTPIDHTARADAPHPGVASRPASSALRFRPDTAAWLAELERRPERCVRAAAPAGPVRRGDRSEGVRRSASGSRVDSVLRRVVVLGTLMGALAMAWSVAGWLAGPGSGVEPVGAGITAEAQTVVVVQPGDTLWSIAQELDPDGDVRATVDRLAARNGGVALTVGQRLVVAD